MFLSSKNIIIWRDTVSISVSTVCAHGQVIGINKEGVGRIYTGDTGVSHYTIGASSLGKGSYSAYFRYTIIMEALIQERFSLKWISILIG